MSGPAVPSLSQAAASLLEAAHAQLLRALDGIDAPDLYHQPTPDTNSIAWLAWHLSRWKDRFGALLVDGPQVWSRDGWAERFGLPAEATGRGDTPAEVASFRPPRDLLLGYVQAAHEELVRRVASLPTEQWGIIRPFSATGEQRSAWQAFVGTLMDAAQHTGQVAYLRGLVQGAGWRD